jgi:hypothetical protein
MNRSDPSILLIYDDAGFIAGIQFAFFKKLVNEKYYPFGSSIAYQVQIAGLSLALGRPPFFSLKLSLLHLRDIHFFVPGRGLVWPNCDSHNCVLCEP